MRASAPQLARNFGSRPSSRPRDPLSTSRMERTSGIRPVQEIAHQTRNSYPNPRIPSMMAARMAVTSSEESVRPADPTVRRNETLFLPSSRGAPEYCRRNWMDSSSGPAKPRMPASSVAANSREPATTERSKALEG